MRSFAVLLALVSVATAFPGMRPAAGSERRDSPTNFPAPPKPMGAAPYSPRFPYTGAKLDGKPGHGVGGIPVPAPGDKDHEYQDPPIGAFRGVCPGLNIAANYGFLSRDGITTFDELVAAQQNVFNFAWDLSTVFATLAIAFDGDIYTERFSIGDAAMWETNGGNTSAAYEGGLSYHNMLEIDTSLTRSDYYLANGNNLGFNGTLWQMMIDTAATTSKDPRNPMFDLKAMTKYKKQRWDQSYKDNGRFWYGPRSLLAYAASSLLYKVLPNSATGTVPSIENLAPIFGAVKAKHGPGNATGGWDHVPEHLPAGWHNKETTYSLENITTEILNQYLPAPVKFGGNHGPGNFQLAPAALNSLQAKATAPDVICQLYDAWFDARGIPDNLDAADERIKWAAKKLNPLFAPFPCAFVAA